MRIHHLVALFLCFGFSFGAFAQDDVSTKNLSYALLPEGKTLPAGVARFRLPYQVATGSTSYDKDGKKSDAAIKYSAKGGAFVAEYGLTDKISLQWRTDFTLESKAEINRSSAAFPLTKQAIYSEKTAALSSVTGMVITDQTSLENAIKTAFIGACSQSLPPANCAAAYDNGSLKSDSATAIGLASSFGPGSDSVPAKAYATAAAAATEAKIEKGMSPTGKGMGDTTLGVLFEAYDSGAVFVALAGGVRIPTGARDLNDAELDTTRGAWEVGGRINVDILPVDWFMISWQNQSEVGIASTTRKKGTATIDTKHDGVRNVGFIYLKPSFEGILSGLEYLRASVGVTYDFDSSEQVITGGKEITTPRSEMIWNYASVGYSLLGWKLPLQFDVEYEVPNRGKNTPIAATKTTYTAKAFARF